MHSFPESARTPVPKRRLRNGRELRHDIEALAQICCGPESPAAMCLCRSARWPRNAPPLGSPLHAAFAPLNPAFCEAEFEVLPFQRVPGAPRNPAPPPPRRPRGWDPIVPARRHPRGHGHKSTPIRMPAVAPILRDHRKTEIGAPERGTLSAMLRQHLRALELSADDRFLSMMPLFHLQGPPLLLAQWRGRGSLVLTAARRSRVPFLARGISSDVV